MARFPSRREERGRGSSSLLGSRSRPRVVSSEKWRQTSATPRAFPQGPVPPPFLAHPPPRTQGIRVGPIGTRTGRGLAAGRHCSERERDAPRVVDDFPCPLRSAGEHGGNTRRTLLLAGPFWSLLLSQSLDYHHYDQKSGVEIPVLEIKQACQLAKGFSFVFFLVPLIRLKSRRRQGGFIFFSPTSPTLCLNSLPHLFSSPH